MHEDESSEKNEGVENGSSEESENGMEFDEAFERDIPDETVLETVHPPADDSGISMDNANLTEKEQTDEAIITQLLERLTLREATITQLQLEIDKSKFKEVAFEGDDKKTKFFTGFTSFKLLSIIHEIAKPHLTNTYYCPLTTFQQLVLTLMKLRLNLCFKDLSYRLSHLLFFIVLKLLLFDH